MPTPDKKPRTPKIKPVKKAGVVPVPPSAAPAEPQSAPEITLGGSRRFWLWTLLGVLVVTAGVQTWGYLTGWGDPERLVQRHLAAGQRLTLARRPDAAIREYGKVLSLKTSEENRRQALIALADLHRERKDWTRAEQLYRELAAQEPSGVLAAWAGLQIADLALAAGRLDAAAQGYAEIMQRYPNSDWDAEAQLGLGQVLTKQERYREAIERYRNLVAQYGGGFLAAEGLVRTGECYEALNNLSAARRSYETVLKEYPQATWDEAKSRLKRLDAPHVPEGVRSWGQDK